MDYKNARPMSQPAGAYNPLEVGRNVVPGRSVLASGDVSGGMITSSDPANIPDNAFPLLKNMRYVDGTRCETRPGTSLLTPAKPNSNKVLRFYDYKQNDGGHTFLRFTRNSIHEKGGAWTAYAAGVGGSITGSDTDRFRLITIFGRCFFTNNGADVIQELDVVANTYKKLGNAPRYKYMTGFYNRILAAYRKNATDVPVEIGWSAEAGVSGTGLDEWDPLVNETAGSSPLIDSPEDFNDFITGLFSFSNVAVVLRERSIWMGTKQPIPTNPFNFYNAFPGVGCDCPDSAKITVNGVTWADSRTNMVWHFSPGQSPEPIGRDIEDEIFAGALDPAQIFSSYSSSTFEYFLCVPQAGTNLVLVWCYNFRTQKWTRPAFDGLSSCDFLDLGPPTLTIGELTGTIAQLTGTIGALGRTGTPAPALVFGRGDGELLQESNTLLSDPVYNNASTTTPVVSEILSKTFTVPKDDVYIAELRINLIPLTPGSVTFRASKDDGASFLSATKILNFNPADIGTPKMMKWVRTIRADRYTFDVVATGKYRFLGYEVHVNRAGDSRGYGVTP